MYSFTITTSIFTLCLLLITISLVFTTDTNKQRKLISLCIMGNKTKQQLDLGCTVDSKLKKIICEKPGSPYFTRCYMSVSLNIIG